MNAHLPHCRPPWHNPSPSPRKHCLCWAHTCWDGLQHVWRQLPGLLCLAVLCMFEGPRLSLRPAVPPQSLPTPQPRPGLADPATFAPLPGGRRRSRAAHIQDRVNVAAAPAPPGASLLFSSGFMIFIQGHCSFSLLPIRTSDLFLPSPPPSSSHRHWYMQFNPPLQTRREPSRVWAPPL